MLSVPQEMGRLFAEGTVTGLSDAELLRRFASERDAAAFDTLVARHGPMVLGVCRGLLTDLNDAEDAFQATFLILVKKAGALRGPVALGGWLYLVARRVAIRANAAAARRRAYERRAGQMAKTTSEPEPPAQDHLLRALHAEIARLPKQCRLAVVLCDLQGTPQDRAAAELRLSERTLRRRLSEGRELLKARLAGRGLAQDQAMLGALCIRAAAPVVPLAWRDATVRAALTTVNQSVTAGVVSAGANALTGEVLKIMLLQKLTLASAALLVAGLITWGSTAVLVSFGQEPAKTSAAGPNPASQPKAKTAVPGSKPDSPDPSGKMTVRGRVLAPDGRPVADAKLYCTPAIDFPWLQYRSQDCATTAPDGRFQFVADRRPELMLGYEKFRSEKTVIAAAAAGFGLGWLEVPAEGPSDELTIQLVEDQPITGQIVDLEGKPVPGATLRVLCVRAAAGEDLGPWLEAAKARKGPSYKLEGQYLPRVTVAMTPKVATDGEGRFRLTGIGRNRLVLALLEGPTIVSQYLDILTRPEGPVDVLKFEKDFARPSDVIATYYGASFLHAAAPTKPIVGVVRDTDTKKPLSGVTITSDRLANDPVGGNQIVQTTTDAQGHYRLTGMPKGERNRIKAVPAVDQPYLVAYQELPDSPGLDPVTADFELKRGIWIEGKITDKATGKPVHANVCYHAQPENPNQTVYGYVPDEATRTANEDGSYRLVGMPGPGIVATRFVEGYLRANERDDDFAIKEVFLPTMTLPTMNYTAIARIDPASVVGSVMRDLTLDPGWTFTGTVVGPDGKPLAGTWGLGLDSAGGPREGEEAMKTAQFTVRRFNPHRPRSVLFLHPQTGLVGVGRPPKNQGESITVELRPGATVTGRLLDQGGNPRASVELAVSRQPKELAQPSEYRYFPQRFKTDQQGRFRIEGLLPEYEFALSVGKSYLPLGGGLQWGQTKDLGDMTIEGD